jgi:hypothetical protein
MKQAKCSNLDEFQKYNNEEEKQYIARGHFENMQNNAPYYILRK